MNESALSQGGLEDFDKIGRFAGHQSGKQLQEFLHKTVLKMWQFSHKEPKNVKERKYV